MRSRVYIFPILVLAMVLGQSISGSSESNIALYSEQENPSGQVDNELLEDPSNNNNPNIDSVRNPTRNFSISNTELTGTLDPVTVEQRGYYATGNTSARTDTNTSTSSDLLLDIDNGWLGSIAEVDVWNLNRLYAVNGSFDDGLAGVNEDILNSITYHPFGWNVTGTETSGGLQTLSAAYDESGTKYVTVQNEGGYEAGGTRFRHYAGTRILWWQNVTNFPYTENFSLSFDYLYSRGPLGAGNFSITIFMNDAIIWNQSLQNLAQRGVWYNTGQISINNTDAGNSFNFSIGLVVNEEILLNKAIWGLVNSMYVAAYLDNIVFTGDSSPAFDKVDFQFTAGNEMAPVIGEAGSGNASILNESYWQSSVVPIEFTSNISVSFEYNARLLSHRFLESTWTTDPTKFGVHYTSPFGASPELSLNTYLGTTGIYEEFTINITHPIDWENATVFDPFLNDVTSQCTLGTGFVIIPESLLDILGWWKVELESYNYAKSIEIQKYDPLTTNWVPSTEFRSGNTTKAAINIGTTTETPTLTDPVNVTWFLPNGTSWSSESVYSVIAGEVNSSKRILGPLNTSAGEWYLEVQWTNGTEIAHAHVPFAMYHSTTLTPQYTEIESEVGPLVTNFLTFIDADNGEYLMDEIAIIVGNWSVSNVNFAPNLLRNWWEGDFNTSRVGGGVFLVRVNSSLPYYDNATCQFTINCIYHTEMNLKDESTVGIYFQETYEIVFYYKYTNGTGISDASVSFEYIGPENGLLNSSPIENNSGNYSINVTGLKIGTYSITISISKEHHEIGSDQIAIVVNEIKTELTSFNGTIGSIGYLEEFKLVVRYTDSSTGHGLPSATVTNASITPSTGLDINSQEIGDGNYSITMQPTVTETFTILIRANLTNYETQFMTFVLTATAIPTTLTLNSSIESIGVTETYTVKITYLDTLNNGIDDATITVVDPPAYLTFSEPTKVPSEIGNYTITIDPSNFGTYLITIAVERDNYQSRVNSFSLTVDPVDTELIIWNGNADFSQYHENYTLVFKYLNSTGYGLPDATVQIMDIAPAIGLIHYTPQDKKDGNYSIILKPNATISFTILIRVNLTAHETQYGTFTLTGTAIPAFLNLNISSATIPYGDQCAVLVSFIDEDSNGLEDADIGITASEGIGIPDIDELIEGNYTININPIQRGSYIITVSATKENYQTQFVSFSLSVEEIETYFEVLNGTSAQVEYGENYRIVLYYSNILEQGLADALVEIDSINPETGLINGTTIPGENGYYSIVLTPTVTSVLFTVIIKAELPNHQTKLASFTLSAIEASTLLNLKETSKTIALDEEYTLYIGFYDQYENGLEGATVEVLDKPVELDIIISEIENGNYSLDFTPSELGSYLLTIRLSKSNYDIASKTFSLTIDEIDTNFILPNGTEASIKYGQNYTLVVRYVSISSIGLTDATIDVMPANPDYELIVGIVDAGENGYYSILLKPNRADIFQLILRANLTNYKSQVTTFTLNVEKIPTTLTPHTPSVSIAVDRNYTIRLFFADDNSTGLENADIAIIPPLPSYELISSDALELGDGFYNITITPLANVKVGDIYRIIFRANLENHQNATAAFELEVTEIPTTLILTGEVSSASIPFSELYEIEIFYLRRDIDENITGALITVSLQPSEGLTWTYNEMDTRYLLSLRPVTIDTWVITITASKDNYREAIRTFKLTSEKIDTYVVPGAGFPGNELYSGQHYSFNISYLRNSNDTGISGAIITSSGTGSEWFQFEELNSGIYNVEFTPIGYTDFTVIINFEKFGYDSASYVFSFIVREKPLTPQEALISYSIQASMILLPLFALIAIQRAYSKRKRKQTLEALAVKRRFDDLKNLIGIIVLHKTSGLPIYSKMLTTGFDSSMISAFITAIRSFRSEIETESAEPEFDLIPISDIVRVVSTRSLLCAFITVTRPTPTQSEKMIEFAKGVGFQFDDLFDMIPAEVIDEETLIQFDYHFDNLMDGKLLKKFRMAESGKFPRGLKCVEKRFEHLELADGFDLDDLALGIASCGFEEARAYKLIMDYIEKGTIVPLNPEEERILDLGWEMEEEKRDNHTSTEASSSDTEDSL